MRLWHVIVTPTQISNWKSNISTLGRSGAGFPHRFLRFEDIATLAVLQPPYGPSSRNIWMDGPYMNFLPETYGTTIHTHNIYVYRSLGAASSACSIPAKLEIDFDFDFDSFVHVGEAKLCVCVRSASSTLGLWQVLGEDRRQRDWR